LAPGENKMKGNVYKGKGKLDGILNAGTNIGFGIRKFAYYTLPKYGYRRGRK
jgi:hypothetical protein